MKREASPLWIENLSAGYPRRPVIRNLSLPCIDGGQVVAFVGPNAAGKSTLLLALAGLLPANGAVRFGDTDLLKLSMLNRARIAAFMPQSLPQGVALTVVESVITAFKASAVADEALIGGSAARTAMLALDRLGIAGLALEGLDRLSGGQRQLVGLAQALVREPRLVLLDEPTSALDLRHQISVMAILRQLASEGRTVIVVLHDLNLAARWADFVVVLDEGAVVAAAAPAAALTADIIARVYGVRARIDIGNDGRPGISIEGLLAPDPSQMSA